MQYLAFLRFQDIRKNILFDTMLYRCLNRFFPAHTLFYVGLCFRYEFRIFPQSVTFVQQFFIMPTVYVDHFTGTFQTPLAMSQRKRIRQIKRSSVFSYITAVIKHNIFRCGQFYPRSTIDVGLFHTQQPFILLCKIKQSPERHIRIPCTLMFIQIQTAVDHKRQIIFHLHKNNVLHRDHFQRLRICV